MPGEQEHHISSVPFFFFITYKIPTCERMLISAPSQPEKAPQNLLLHGKLNSGLLSLLFERNNCSIISIVDEIFDLIGF